MCGIAGYANLLPHLGASGAEYSAQAARMAQALAHRGPDDQGTWVDPAAGIALGFRRLAIIDLSPAGHQPMESASGRYVLVFNGEIYNHRDLRRQVGDFGYIPDFRGHSDTEALLAAIETWGLAGALERCVGMFALALWDRRDRVLQLARDRMGEKPLYYGLFRNTLLFASELKALRTHRDWAGEIDRNSLALFMRHGYVPAPYSIYRNVFKLSPAAILSVPVGQQPLRALPEPVPYWSLRKVVEDSEPLDCSDEEAIEALDRLLREAVALQSIADVPLGAFLSGGIDSSTIVALMQAQTSRPVRTFSIGFHEADYDESVYAAQVARHLGTNHSQLHVTHVDAQRVIPQLPAIYDEPFGDSSQIPTFLLAKLTRQSVTVSLSGDGGDELFYGYPRYRLVRQVWHKGSWMPRSARNLLGKVVRGTPAAVWDRGLKCLTPLLAHYGRRSRLSDKMHRAGQLLTCDSLESLYRAAISIWRDPAQVVVGTREHAYVLNDPNQWLSTGEEATRLQFLDALTYLPDDILVKVDRAAMAVSLESRVPLLDHRIVEFAWRLPNRFKERAGQGKWLLRQVLDRYVPSELVDRPKMGFGIPLDQWLRGPLREWAADLLDARALRQEGYFAADVLQQKLQQHLAGDANWQHDLWFALMFQAWLLNEKRQGDYAQVAA